jgi:hypothetical protein
MGNIAFGNVLQLGSEPLELVKGGLIQRDDLRGKRIQRQCKGGGRLGSLAQRLTDLFKEGLLQIDLDILSLLPSFAPYRPELAVSFLKEIAVRGDTTILRRIADILAQPDAMNDGWDVKIADKQDCLDIFQKFERLPELDHTIERCLNRLGQFEPRLVVDFLEQRVLNTAEHQLKAKNYRAIPQGSYRFTLQ